jgi:hypothetical protein
MIFSYYMSFPFPHLIAIIPCRWPDWSATTPPFTQLAQEGAAIRHGKKLIDAFGVECVDTRYAARLSLITAANVANKSP